ncbi:MAG TPA: hypothetical protein ENO27_01080 [Caldithrix sp.]|nr:hypothetical protein [Calditrichaceae bacterium]HEM48779.1 hypothetical protein [Caldithrix sp.]
MSKIELYTNEFLKTNDRIRYLMDHSNLPGPRGNLELLFAVQEVGDESFFFKCLKYNESVAPTNTPGEFVATCGAAGLGKLIAEAKTEYFEQLKKLAADNRWRVREGVAFALQYIGKQKMDLLLTEMKKWMKENLFVQRAIVAGLCEPVLIKNHNHAGQVLDILTEIIQNFSKIENRKDESFRVLKKGLAYGLSVAVVAFPEKGKQAFAVLAKIEDKDIRWILKENLKKNRLIKMDEAWVKEMNLAIS